MEIKEELRDKIKDFIYYETNNGILLKGHVVDMLDLLPNEFINMSITSPPYWNLRDYGNETKVIWGGDKSCKHEWKKEKVSCDPRIKKRIKQEADQYKLNL